MRPSTYRDGTMRLMPAAATALAALILLHASVPAQGGKPERPAAILLRKLVQVLGSGDQANYARFAARNYAPAALADASAEDQASSLARVYADTGGFVLERVTAASDALVQAEAHDRVAGLRYCLTLKHTASKAGPLVTEFGTRALYPAGPSLADPSPGEVTRTIGALADAYAQRGLFSGVILLAKDEKVIFEKAYGPASIAFDRPMSLATRLNVASIGKSLTGTAIAQLVEAGRLSYDDPVGKILPDYPDKDVRDKATIRQLLSHTSGMGPQDYYERPAWAAARSGLRSLPDYLTLIGGTTIGSEPGKYLYSNSGYVILGAVIERVSGQSFYDYVAGHIFKPAGMTHSFYHEMDAEDPDVATPLTNLFARDGGYIYRLGRPRSAVLELPARGGPQGGAFMTAEDLFAFERALRGGKLIGAASFAAMTTAQSASGAGAQGLSGDVREGLGIEVIVQNGHRLFGHTGGDLGVASFVYWYPDLGYTTIALTNRDPRAARVLANVSRALLTRRTIGGAPPPPQACTPP